jgi:hypothetical protein
MAFTLHSRDQQERFTGEARYHFNEAGLLIVTLEDGRQRTYSPNGWEYLEVEAAPHDLTDSVH